MKAKKSTLVLTLSALAILLSSAFSCGRGTGEEGTPAALSLSNLSIHPTEVEPNEAVTVTVDVANTGVTKCCGATMRLLSVELAESLES